LSRKTRRRFFAALGAVAALAVAGIAIAYFTNSGSGSGTATVGTSVALTVNGSTLNTLYPGSSSEVDFTVDNTGSAHQFLNTITLSSVKACVGSGSSWDGTACSNGGTHATGCESFDTSSSSSSDNFSMLPVAAHQDVAPGTGTTVTQHGTLVLNDLNSSQDACKNANLTLGFTTS